jgi:hypothetical protein
MEACRVDGTNVGQRWRVTGFQAGDRSFPAGDMCMVALEFWLGEQMFYPLPLTFDPELARTLGEHLIEMADHAQEVPPVQ